MTESDGWDHVVIGAGSAGAVLAARLSENPRRRVLLLEAGPDHRASATPDGVRGPSMWSALATPGRVWPDLVATHSAATPPAPYARGRGVGGSSAVNAMISLRGLPEEYDRWAQELGCSGWDGATLTALFDDVEAAPSGTLQATCPPRARWTPIERALETAAGALDYEHYEALALCARDGRRISTNDAYLEPARDRDNLEIRGDVLVDRILLDGRRAVGVRTADGHEIAADSVVVSAGALHSPALLLRSGVGTDDGLRVGHNLMDHPAVIVAAVLAEHAQAEPGQHVINSALRYTSGFAGRLDMQIVPLGYGPDPAGRAVALLCVSAMQVFSRGRVTLSDDDPRSDPRVDFAMLDDERDRVRMLDGIRRLRDLVAQPAVRSSCTGLLAGDRPLDELDDAAIESWLEGSVGGYAHAAGTCRMGAPGDPAAVTDPQCAVLGYDHLRVVDASVIPDIPRANTNLTTVAIAERIGAQLR